ncbi:MAG: hypothetical protein QM698_09120 [Micropepsaceae bacterium]
MSKKVFRPILLSIVFLSTSVADDKEEQIGKWHYLTLEDAMTDELRYATAVVNPGRVRDESFGFMCVKGGRDSIFVMYTSASFLGISRSTDSIRDTAYRVDDRPAVSQKWKYIDGYKAGLPIGEPSNNVANDLRDGKRLRLRLTKFDGTTLDAEFDIEGASDALGRLERDCASKK